MPNQAKTKMPVGIVAKASKPKAVALARKVIEWLENQQLDYRIDREVISAFADLKVQERLILERSEVAKQCDPIVVMGGDGTLISVSRYAESHSPTIVAVNMGMLGFLTEISAEQAIDTLALTLAGKVERERRPLLCAKVSQRGKVSIHHALNDVVITKEAIARIFSVDVSVNREFATRVRGDGVIVATPVGSTAYSLSAGGSIVHPGVSALLVTPICPHSVASRPFVLPGNSEISLDVVPELEEEESVYLTIDGQVGMALFNRDQVSVTTSERGVYFVRSPSRGYFEILGSKLKWASESTGS